MIIQCNTLKYLMICLRRLKVCFRKMNIQVKCKLATVLSEKINFKISKTAVNIASINKRKNKI